MYRSVLLINKSGIFLSESLSPTNDYKTQRETIFFAESCLRMRYLLYKAFTLRIHALDKLSTFFKEKSVEKIAMMEIFGGNAGVTRMSMKLRLRCGPSVDIISGTDLTDKHEALRLLALIDSHKPEVIVMGPPCTAMVGPFGACASRRAETCPAVI